MLEVHSHAITLPMADNERAFYVQLGKRIAATRKDNNLLLLDFYFRGIRCREQTALPDSKENRRRVQTLMNRIKKEIQQGVFDYAATFPGSPRAAQC